MRPKERAGKKGTNSKRLILALASTFTPGHHFNICTQRYISYLFVLSSIGAHPWKIYCRDSIWTFSNLNCVEKRSNNNSNSNEHDDNGKATPLTWTLQYFKHFAWTFEWPQCIDNTFLCAALVPAPFLRSPSFSFVCLLYFFVCVSS